MDEIITAKKNFRAKLSFLSVFLKHLRSVVNINFRPIYTCAILWWSYLEISYSNTYYLYKTCYTVNIELLTSKSFTSPKTVAVLSASIIDALFYEIIRPLGPQLFMPTDLLYLFLTLCCINVFIEINSMQL